MSDQSGTNHPLRPRPSPRAAAWAVGCLLLGTPAAGQPPFYEPPEHYYKAQGRSVKVEWKLDRTEVPEGGRLTVTLVIRGATNPQEVVRPDLRKLPEFASRFEIEDMPGRPAAAGAKEVSFDYRLRPRNRSVDGVPTLRFYYHNPSAPPGKQQYPQTTAKGVPIKVTAAATKEQPRQVVPLGEPEHLLQIATGPRMLGREPFVPGWSVWLLLVIAGPLVAGGWYVVWRRVYPDAARLARIRRSRAARRAADAIRRAGRTPDPPGTIAAAVLGYLRARFPLPPGAETPPEIGDGLRAAGLPDPEAAAAVAFFRHADEARFGGSSDTELSLAAGAEALLGRLEAVE
jgi:hypothetical protein